MPEALTVPSLKVLFRFPLAGRDAQSRFALGAVLTFAGTVIPIVPTIFVYGYLIGVLRQAIRGQEPEMQPWQDWGRLAKDGVLALIIGLVFTLPATIVMLGGFAVYFAGSIVVPLSVADTGAPEEAAAVVSAWVLGSMVILFLSMFLGTVLLVLGLVPLPAALAHFAAEDRFGAAFRVGQWWPIFWRNKLGYLVAWVVGFGLVGLIYLLATLAYLTVCLCCLAPVMLAPLGFYVSLVACAVFGQTYREGVAGAESGPPDLPLVGEVTQTDGRSRSATDL